MIKTLKTEAYERISRELVGGNIKPGDPINETNLEKQQLLTEEEWGEVAGF